MPKKKQKPHPPRPTAKPIDPDQALLKLNQAGVVLGAHEATVYRLAREGVIPSLRLGRSIRIPRKALDAMIAEGKIGKGLVKVAKAGAR